MKNDTNKQTTALVEKSISEDLLLIDWGASYHATPYANYFVTYTSSDFGKVYMDNKSVVNIVGMGDVHLLVNGGSKLILKNVRYILDLIINLIYH